MKLRNVLITVGDMERSVAFYRELFGLEVILRQDGNVIMTEGLVLQDAKIWKEALGRDIVPGSNACELYFEETDLEKFADKLENYREPVEYVTRLTACDRGKRILRFYDPDGNLIEVGTPH